MVTRLTKAQRRRVPDALIEVEATRWQCMSCTDAASEDDQYCISCRLYWDDVRAGLFDDYDPALQEPSHAE